MFNGLISYKNGMKGAIATQVCRVSKANLITQPCFRASLKCIPAQSHFSNSNLIQIGLVQFRNMTLADNGAGPLQHIVNGKDNGAGFEMTWIVDDRRWEGDDGGDLDLDLDPA